MLVTIVTEQKKKSPKFLQKQTTQAAKEILNYMNKMEDIMLPSFQIQYRTSIIETQGIGIGTRSKTISSEKRIKK